MSSARKLPDQSCEDVVAPDLATWAALREDERAAVRAALPIVVEHDFMSEGDPHSRAVFEFTEMLDGFYRRGGGGGRPFYIGRSLMVHYPLTRGFAPDLMVVFDVSGHDRYSWIVPDEGKGLDFALEITSRGDRSKDLVRNVNLYASVGIPEYFVFDVERGVLHGFRLAPGTRTYAPIVGQHGRYHSEVLGLDLAREGRRLRLLSGGLQLPTAAEYESQIQQAIQREIDLATRADERAEAESQRAEAESQRAEAESQRAEVASERAKAESERAEAASQRAETESVRAEAEARRAEALAERLTEESRRAAAAEAELADLRRQLAAQRASPDD